MRKLTRKVKERIDVIRECLIDHSRTFQEIFFLHPEYTPAQIRYVLDLMELDRTVFALISVVDGKIRYELNVYHDVEEYL